MKQYVQKLFYSALVTMCLLLLLLSSCKKEEEPEYQPFQAKLPVVTTVSISNVLTFSAISGGTITSDGGAPILDKGVCWSHEKNPSLNNKTNDGTGTGSFSSNLTGLTKGTKYYVWAYATNSEGTAFGEIKPFKTQGGGAGTGSVIDIDNTIYNTVTIGTQIWMAENLKVTRYTNGDLIGTTTFYKEDVSEQTEPKYQWIYGNDINNVEVYGRLYTWYVVNDDRGVCPSGWHVPSDTEWNTMVNFLGGKDSIAVKLKATGIYTWTDNNFNSTNASGFAAFPGGYRNAEGPYVGIKSNAIWWSSTEYSMAAALNWQLYYENNNISSGAGFKEGGHSIRCIKN